MDQLNKDQKPTDSSSKHTQISRRRTLQATGAGLAVGLAGCLGIGEDDDDVLTIGHLAPTSLDMGLGSERSAILAVEEINENGGILDQEVELISEDDEGLPGTAQTEAERLVERENISFMVGTFTSESTQGIMDYMGDSDVPFFISGSADPFTLQSTVGEDYDRYKNIFRPAPINSDYQAEFAADYCEFLADEYGWTQVAHIPEEAAWTNPFTELVPGFLEERGLDVVMDIRLSRDTDDFVPVLDDAEAAGAEILLKFFAHIPGPGMLAAWRENEYPFAQEGINVASMSPQFWDDTDGGAEYETTSENGGGGRGDVTELSIPFAENYQARFEDEGRPTLPMYMGYGTYDAIHLYKDIVERAGTADFENDLDDIVDAALNSEFTGASGVITFHEPDHDYAHDAVAGVDLLPFPVTQWQSGGQKECIYPTEFASADHVAAPWLE